MLSGLIPASPPDASPAAQAIRGASPATGTAEEAGRPGVELTAKAGDVATFPSGNRPGTRAGGQRAEMLVREIVTTDGQGRPAA